MLTFKHLPGRHDQKKHGNRGVRQTPTLQAPTGGAGTVTSQPTPTPSPTLTPKAEREARLEQSRATIAKADATYAQGVEELHRAVETARATAFELAARIDATRKANRPLLSEAKRMDITLAGERREINRMEWVLATDTETRMSEADIKRGGAEALKARLAEFLAKHNESLAMRKAIEERISQAEAGDYILSAKLESAQKAYEKAVIGQYDQEKSLLEKYSAETTAARNSILTAESRRAAVTRKSMVRQNAANLLALNEASQAHNEAWKDTHDKWDSSGTPEATISNQKLVEREKTTYAAMVAEREKTDKAWSLVTDAAIPGNYRPDLSGLDRASFDADLVTAIDMGITRFNQLSPNNPILNANRVKVQSMNQSQAILGERASIGANTITLNPFSLTPETIVHELGHTLEMTDPFVRSSVLEYYRKRTRGEDAIPLSTVTGDSRYSKHEKTKIDRFTHPYMGKDYDGYATEILSMGLAALANRKEAHDLLKNDPEMLDFIVSVVRGAATARRSIGLKHLMGKHDQKRHGWRHTTPVREARVQVAGRAIVPTESAPEPPIPPGVSPEKVQIAMANVAKERTVYAEKVLVFYQERNRTHAEYEVAKTQIEGLKSEKDAMESLINYRIQERESILAHIEHVKTLGSPSEEAIAMEELAKFDMKTAEREAELVPIREAHAAALEVFRKAADAAMPYYREGSEALKLTELRKTYIETTAADTDLLVQAGMRDAAVKRKAIVRKLDTRLGELKAIDKELTFLKADYGSMDVLGREATARGQQLVQKIFNLQNQREALYNGIKKSIAPLIYNAHGNLEPSMGPSVSSQIGVVLGLKAFNELVAPNPLLDNFRPIIRADKRSSPGFASTRSWFEDGTRSVVLSDYFDIGTTIPHELGHALEAADPAILRQANIFLERRTRNENTEPLRNIDPTGSYGEGEHTRKDKFVHPYMGKEYKPFINYSGNTHQSHTEIISMGLGMLSNVVTLRELIAKDPEYFDLVYAIIRLGSKKGRTIKEQTYKHFPGRHDQKRHGWRYGTVLTPEKIDALVHSGSLSEYQRRANKRAGVQMARVDPETLRADRVKLDAARVKYYNESSKAYADTAGLYLDARERFAVWSTEEERLMRIIDSRRNRTPLDVRGQYNRARMELDRAREDLRTAERGMLQTGRTFENDGKDYALSVATETKRLADDLMIEGDAVRAKMLMRYDKGGKVAELSAQVRDLMDRYRRLGGQLSGVLPVESTSGSTGDIPFQMQEIKNEVSRLTARIFDISERARKELSPGGNGPIQIVKDVRPQFITTDAQGNAVVKMEGDDSSILTLHLLNARRLIANGNKALENIPLRSGYWPFDSNDNSRAGMVSTTRVIRVSHTKNRGWTNLKTDTLVHEMGHWMENYDPTIGKLAYDYVESRTRGEAEVSLGKIYHNPSMNSEMTRIDHFLEPYMGKNYGGGRDTELVSSGLAYYYRNPIELARRDPDLFNFIYAITHL